MIVKPCLLIEIKMVGAHARLGATAPFLVANLNLYKSL